MPSRKESKYQYFTLLITTNLIQLQKLHSAQEYEINTIVHWRNGQNENDKHFINNE